MMSSYKEFMQNAVEGLGQDDEGLGQDDEGLGQDDSFVLSCINIKRG
jgi:hypothetical protein